MARRSLHPSRLRALEKKKAAAGQPRTAISARGRAGQEDKSRKRGSGRHRVPKGINPDLPIHDPRYSRQAPEVTVGNRWWVQGARGDETDSCRTRVYTDYTDAAYATEACSKEPNNAKANRACLLLRGWSNPQGVMGRCQKGACYPGARPKDVQAFQACAKQTPLRTSREIVFSPPSKRTPSRRISREEAKKELPFLSGRRGRSRSRRRARR